MNRHDDMTKRHVVSPPPLKRQRLNSHRPSTSQYPRGSEECQKNNATNVKTFSTGSKDILSIYAWNINGIKPFLQQDIKSFFKTSPTKSPPPKAPEASRPDLRACLARWHYSQVVFLQEVHIARSDAATKRAVLKAANAQSKTDTGPAYEAHFCLPTDAHNARGLGGHGAVHGVASLLLSDFAAQHVARVRTVDWDSEGRVQVVELKAESAHGRLALFNVYAVNGTLLPWRDSVTGGVVGTRHDKKREFHGKLLEECLKLESRGFSVVLAGDMNVARDWRDGTPGIRLGKEHVVNRWDFERKFFSRAPRGEEDEIVEERREEMPCLEGIDTFREVHGDERRYSYHPPGREWGSSADRVDLIIVSKGLKERILEAGILDSELERGSSDHVPILLKLRALGHGASTSTGKLGSEVLDQEDGRDRGASGVS